MGKQYLCTLVQEYIDRKLENDAYEVITKNHLREEFPEAYHQGKESKLKKLDEKGCWDVAEARTKNDRQLLEYLICSQPLMAFLNELYVTLVLLLFLFVGKSSELLLFLFLCGVGMHLILTL
ncbi:PREDICTED: uncharacterized protein LOC109179147 [Ipomoea nil]|uniref:uncharacterized protein LOC109179147 n=1 Tax=Ipomoea nil TaxID=35883 RepID=UPI000901EF92|nr:PREDICTED: uncharacterized protein LOC109179147 [Ipomoea nil]XP_019184257.1 PREDICTED: uncharacterized protein LOC109179147 [Ipomoea nil]XP_019184258.1 PREDICTED: uncharacterized protein LOC109179147 [Ipomoea nil]XP_019184259.1 PREDICTED: uncharacterized protein LOC109179147 [Ipomoea nil]